MAWAASMPNLAGLRSLPLCRNWLGCHSGIPRAFAPPDDCLPQRISCHREQPAACRSQQVGPENRLDGGPEEYLSALALVLGLVAFRLVLTNVRVGPVDLGLSEQQGLARPHAGGTHEPDDIGSGRQDVGKDGLNVLVAHWPDRFGLSSVHRSAWMRRYDRWT